MVELTAHASNDQMKIPHNLRTLLKLAKELGFEVYDLHHEHPNTAYEQFYLKKRGQKEYFSTGDIEPICGHLRFMKRYTCERTCIAQTANTDATATEQSPNAAGQETKLASSESMRLAQVEERVRLLEQRVGARYDTAELTKDEWYYLSQYEEMIPEFKKYGGIISIDQANKQVFFTQVHEELPTYGFNATDYMNVQAALFKLRKQSQEKELEKAEKITATDEASNFETQPSQASDNANKTEVVSDIMARDYLNRLRERAEALGNEITMLSELHVLYSYSNIYDRIFDKATDDLMPDDCLDPSSYPKRRWQYRIPEELHLLNNLLTAHETFYNKCHEKTCAAQ